MVQYGGGLGGAKIDKALVAGTFNHALSGLAGGGVNIHGNDARLALVPSSRARALRQQLLPQGGVMQLPALKAPALADGTRARSVRIFTASSSRPPPAHEASTSVGRASFS
ncbi:MAG: hypothetical protein ACLUQW_09255 [Collinsella sp.]